MARQHRLRFAIAVAIALRVTLIAIAWLVRGPDTFVTPDSQSYVSSATTLATRFSFTDGEGRPELFRTPGYPLLLVPGVWIGTPILFAIAAQLILSAAIVALVYAIVRRLFADAAIAGLCALLVAIEPTVLLWSMKVMSETLFIVCLLAFVMAALRAHQSGDQRWVVGSAIALVSAVYVRPIAYPLVILVTLALLMSPRKALVFIATCAVLLAPWHLRNFQETGFSGFSTVFDRAAYISAGGSIVARRNHQQFADVRLRMVERASKVPPSEIRREGMALLASDPGGYAMTHLSGMIRTIFEPGAVEYLRTFGLYPEGHGALLRVVDQGFIRSTLDFASRDPLAFWVSVVMGVALLPFVAVPFVAARVVTSGRRRVFFLLAALIAYFVLASGGVPGSSRFRAPVMPLVIIMVGFILDARKCTTG